TLAMSQSKWALSRRFPGYFPFAKPDVRVIRTPPNGLLPPSVDGSGGRAGATNQEPSVRVSVQRVQVRDARTGSDSRSECGATGSPGRDSCRRRLESLFL